MVAEALLGQEQHARAEPLLLSGYEGLKPRQEEIPQRVRVQRLIEAVDRLIALYTALNRPEDVQTWRAEKARLSATRLGQQGGFHLVRSEPPFVVSRRSWCPASAGLRGVRPSSTSVLASFRTA
jgi:hypothetical protein